MSDFVHIGETAKEWLERNRARLERIGELFAAKEREMGPVTYACATCCDRIYVHWPTGSGVWFCQSCDAGLMAEAGHWRHVRTPQHGNQRQRSVAGMAKWDTYRHAHPERADRISAAIARIVAEERSRKAAESEEA